MNEKIAVRFVAIGSSLFAAWYALQGEAQGEEIGGALTGNFNIANYAGALLLLTTAFLGVLRWPRAAKLAIAGLLLVMPMQSWRLMPGLWCSAGNCSVSQPYVQWNTASVQTLVFALLAAGLFRQLDRP